MDQTSRLRQEVSDLQHQCAILRELFLCAHNEGASHLFTRGDADAAYEMLSQNYAGPEWPNAIALGQKGAEEFRCWVGELLDRQRQKA